jgi:dienelactone hydrolase
MKEPDRIEEALNRRLLPEPIPEDPDSCELHRFILTKTTRFECPDDVSDWPATASRLRQRCLEEVYLRGHPMDLLSREPSVEWRGTLETGGGYRIRKLLYEGYPGMQIPALLYEPTNLSGPVPAVLNPNGHHSGGKAMDYKQARCINLAKRGMLALSTEFIGMGELCMNVPHNRISHMDLCGSAGVAVFYLAMKRGLDVLLSHPNCDPQRVAVTGLSGGGWQSILLGALDERVKVIVPVAGHSPIWQRPSSTSDVGDLEQNPPDICSVCDYDTLTALCAPRPLLLMYNRDDDCCFKAERTRVSIYEPVKPFYELLGVGDRIEFHENVDPGTHNYEADNRSQLYRFLNKHFGLDGPEEDLPFENELFSETQLGSGIPDDNSTLSSLARNAARGLPRSRFDFDGNAESLRRAREDLGEVIRLRRLNVEDNGVDEADGVEQHLLRMNDTWTIPVTCIHPETENGSVMVLLADGGRRAAGPHARGQVAQGLEVVAADVFGTGESTYLSHQQMVLSAVGGRPLGVLVGQILALLEWAALRSHGERVGLSALGRVTSFGSLCAAALKPDSLDHLHLEGLPDSLKRLIDLPVEYEQALPLFCFGLLERFDIRDLMGMAEGLPIELPGRGPIQPVVPLE